jgi:predicted dehydrogenase
MTRRSFVAGSALSALGAARAVGANERIRVGMLGCGNRNLLAEVLRFREEANLEVAAVCDIWRQHREDAAARVKETSGQAPDMLHAQEDLFARDDIDAVVIGTPDHQHCLQLIDAVEAGKDAYVEKPLAMDLKELNKAYDAVKKSDRVVQMGTQVRSFPSSVAARELVRKGGLGKIFKIEQARNSYKPYWYRYAERRIEQGDTDWKRFLMQRKPRPWDPQQHAGWFGYRDFSQGPHSNLGVHFLDLAHFITESGPPTRAVAMAGCYRWNKDGFTCPDSIELTLEYPEKGFLVRYCSTFGCGGNSFLKFFGTRGEMDASRWGDPFLISGKTVQDEDRIAEGETIPEMESPHHMLNFFQCVRSRKTPNAPIEAGHAHSVAAILADESFVRGRCVVYDPRKRTIKNG